jgi:hypothetical protein
MMPSAVNGIIPYVDTDEQLREFDRKLNVVYDPYDRPTDQNVLLYDQLPAYLPLMSLQNYECVNFWK